MVQVVVMKYIEWCFVLLISILISKGKAVSMDKRDHKSTSLNYNIDWDVKAWQRMLEEHWTYWKAD